MAAESLLQQLQKYLAHTMGLPVRFHPWDVAGALPLYLREHYRFFRMEVADARCVLMADTAPTEQSPVITGKHVTQIRSRLQCDVVYGRSTLSAYNRRRLIENRIPFVVPGAQIYLPMLWIDLRERMRRASEKRSTFSPATQAFILDVLYRPRTDVLLPSKMAGTLGYSAMTMTRAFNELEAADIGEHAIAGKERRLRFTVAGRPLWEQTLPFLTTPVKRRLYVNSGDGTLPGLPAGQSALTLCSAIAEPDAPVRALSRDNWNAWSRENRPAIVPIPEPGTVEIELWKYDPQRLAAETCVDSLSLYLSLQDSVDDRVQIALDELLKGMPW